MAEENTILGNTQDNTTATVTETDPVVTPTQESTGADSGSGNNSAAFDYATMVNAEGGLSENWRQALPENLRNEKCLDNIKTFGTLVQSYVHAQKAMGAKRLAVPGESSTPEEWSDFYKALGRPDKAEDYKSDTVEMPEGFVLDGDQMAAFRKFAFEHGLSQKTFEAALAFDVQRNKASYEKAVEAHNQEYNETIGKLKEEYGSNFTQLVDSCNSAMATFGLTEVMREKGLLNNYTMIKALAEIGEKIGESKLKGDGGTVSVSPESRLEEIRNNYDDPYYQKDHPAHKARVAEVNKLLAAISAAKK